MPRVTIEDAEGNEKSFAVSEELAKKVKTCVSNKVNERLGKEKSSIVRMVNEDGDIVSFFLERNCGGDIEVRTFMEDESDDAEAECVFESDGNSIVADGHYFS